MAACDTGIKANRAASNKTICDMRRAVFTTGIYVEESTINSDIKRRVLGLYWIIVRSSVCIAQASKMTFGISSPRSKVVLKTFKPLC
ncbi:MAG TPA: hypothetical protein DCY57_01305 [Bacteroidetes bacterium]|nr:hypothetical protein [Bacteroidota bacterium]